MEENVMLGVWPLERINGGGTSSWQLFLAKEVDAQGEAAVQIEALPI